MSCHFDDEVIDLTRSSTKAVHNNGFFLNVIILDSDESFVDLNTSAEQSSPKEVSKVKKVKRKPTTINKDNPLVAHRGNPQSSTKLSGSGQKHNFGECPICWDELGKNRLASTKCGHVFCLKCLERSLKIEKKCPTCRKVLKNNSDYHPLYLSTY